MYNIYNITNDKDGNAPEESITLEESEHIGAKDIRKHYQAEIRKYVAGNGHCNITLNSDDGVAVTFRIEGEIVQ